MYNHRNFRRNGWWLRVVSGTQSLGAYFNGGVDAAAEQIKAKQYAEPFKADKRKVIALAVELDDLVKGLVDWKEV